MCAQWKFPENPSTHPYNTQAFCTHTLSGVDLASERTTTLTKSTGEPALTVMATIAGVWGARVGTPQCRTSLDGVRTGWLFSIIALLSGDPSTPGMLQHWSFTCWTFRWTLKAKLLTIITPAPSSQLHHNILLYIQLIWLGRWCWRNGRVSAIRLHPAHPLGTVRWGGLRQLAPTPPLPSPRRNMWPTPRNIPIH